jgi:homoserine O-acetyltransferase/O-succinyltransferase
MRHLLRALLLLCLAVPATAQTAQTSWPVSEADFTIVDFRFGSGETLPSLVQHYRTLGTPQRDKAGNVTNAVAILHGTGGTGATFLRPIFAGELFGPGQPLDASRFFIIIPDAIGHGGSSRPSNGLRMGFPEYDYADMVRAQKALFESLGIKQLRLLMGTSMGCMMSFQFGIDYPGAARALMPLACNAVELAGRNRLWRQIAIDAIKADPDWQGGNYTKQPVNGAKVGVALQILASSAPVRMQAQWPTRVSADKAAADLMAGAQAGAADANDRLYQLDASRNYNPSPSLARITVPVTWINSADDFINPPGLGLAERDVAKMPGGKFVLIPESPETQGHGTHTAARFWKAELIDLLKRSE